MRGRNMLGILVKRRSRTASPGQRLRESSLKWALNGCSAEPVQVDYNDLNLFGLTLAGYLVYIELRL